MCAQPVPKAAYRSGRRDKHNRSRCDSNPGPLTPQSDALTTRLLTHASPVSRSPRLWWPFGSMRSWPIPTRSDCVMVTMIDMSLGGGTRVSTGTMYWIKCVATWWIQWIMSAAVANITVATCFYNRALFSQLQNVTVRGQCCIHVYF